MSNEKIEVNGFSSIKTDNEKLNSKIYEFLKLISDSSTISTEDKREEMKKVLASIEDKLPRLSYEYLIPVYKKLLVEILVLPFVISNSYNSAINEEFELINDLMEKLKIEVNL